MQQLQPRGTGPHQRHASTGHFFVSAFPGSAVHTAVEEKAGSPELCLGIPWSISPDSPRARQQHGTANVVGEVGAISVSHGFYKPFLKACRCPLDASFFLLQAHLQSYLVVPLPRPTLAALTPACGRAPAWRWTLLLPWWSLVRPWVCSSCLQARARAAAALPRAAVNLITLGDGTRGEVIPRTPWKMLYFCGNTRPRAVKIFIARVVLFYRYYINIEV